MRSRRTRMFRSWMGLVAAAALSVGLSAQAVEVVDKVPVVSAESGVMIGAVSYRHDKAVEYTLDDLNAPPTVPMSSVIVDRLAAGDDKVCCLSLPKRWRPGLKVRVNWRELDHGQPGATTYKRELTIPRYSQVADIFVVFHAGNEVELVMSAAEPGQPGWAGRIKKAPWDVCLAEVGRKACASAVPDPIFAGLRQVCVQTPQDPNCKAYFDYCKQHQNEGACPP